MSSRTPVALVLAAALWVGGCGTMDNVKRPFVPPPENPAAPVCKVYGGLRGDFFTILKYPWVNPPSYLDYVVIPVLAVIDLGFDVVGDTLTLPYTIFAPIRRAFDNPENSPPPVTPAVTPNAPLPPTPPLPPGEPIPPGQPGPSGYPPGTTVPEVAQPINRNAPRRQ